MRIEPGSNQIRLLFRDTADNTLIAVTKSPYNDGEWHHMAATVGPAGKQEKTARFYIDGKLEQEINGKFGEMKSTESVTLGSRFVDAPMKLSKEKFLAVSPPGKLATTWGDVKN